MDSSFGALDAFAFVVFAGFLRELETGRMLSLAVVTSNVVTVIASLSLDNFAKARQGVAAQIFEQKLEGNWERPADEINRN